ncbi:YjcZ family sporulation protein [Lysinibacillus sp. NPDC096418]
MCGIMTTSLALNVVLFVLLIIVGI